MRNFGNGTLELTGDTVRFYTERGRIKKQKEIVKEIPIADIESIERHGNELNITWNESNYAFVSEKAELAESIYAKVTEALEKQQKKTLDDKEAASQTQNQLAEMLGVVIEIVDALFDILRSLQGQVDWSRVENYLNRSEENIKVFTIQNRGTLNLNVKKLSSAIKDRQPKETAKETYSILTSLYEYFSGLPVQDETPEQIHPNIGDAKKLMLTYYTLNDVVLGITVEDEEIRKEINEFIPMIDDFSKGTYLKVNADEVKDNVNKLSVEKEKENLIEESRAAFIQQLKEQSNHREVLKLDNSH